MPGNSIEFWFDFASTYSYIAALRIEREAKAAGAEVVWRPFLLGPIFSAQLGLNDSPFKTQPMRRKYMFRDLERLCAKYELPWRFPSVFPQNSVLAARIGCAIQEEPGCGDYVRAVFTKAFGEDQDISSEAVLTEVLRGLGKDAEAIFARALAPEHKGKLREQTTQAASKGLFGAPNFFVQGEHFFGQDRLEDALAWLKKPLLNA